MSLSSLAKGVIIVLIAKYETDDHGQCRNLIRFEHLSSPQNAIANLVTSRIETII